MDPIGRTIELALANAEDGGRPSARVVVRGGEALAESPNLVARTKDPTAHAEVLAVREACKKPETDNLYGCEVCVLAHPCPTCLGALYYASPDGVVFVLTREEYSRCYTDDRKYFGFGTFYEEFSEPRQERRLPMAHRPDAEGLEVYERWRRLNP